MTADKGWIVAQLGARDYFMAGRILHRAGLLAALYTDCWVPSAVRSAVGPRLAARLKRYHDDIPDRLVRAENIGMLLRRLKHEQEPSKRWIDEGGRLARRVAGDVMSARVPRPGGVLGYTGGSLEMMQLAAENGLIGVHAQVDPGRAWYEIRNEALERWPGAEDELVVSAEYLERVDAELELANTVVANSAYSASCLVQHGVPSSKIRIAPLCVDYVSAATPRRLPKNGEPFRVLFAGSVGVAKGFPYFAEAASMLREGFEFLAAGSVKLSSAFLAKQGWPVTLLGHVPRQQLWSLMRSCHALVFPTLCDGFGLVQLEAMANGLPVVATRNCGDVVVDGRSGYRIEAYDSSAIAEAISRLRGNPALFEQMSLEAIKTVDRYSISKVAPAWLDALSWRSEGDECS